MKQRVIRITKARITATAPTSFMKPRVIRFPLKVPTVTIVMPRMKTRLISKMSKPPLARQWYDLQEARRSRRCWRGV
jgi:hypothetical protein